MHTHTHTHTHTQKRSKVCLQYSHYSLQLIQKGILQTKSKNIFQVVSNSSFVTPFLTVSVTLSFLVLPPSLSPPSRPSLFSLPLSVHSEFHPRLLGLTGTEEEIERATKAYRVYSTIGPSDSPDDYLVHTRMRAHTHTHTRTHCDTHTHTHTHTH